MMLLSASLAGERKHLTHLVSFTITSPNMVRPVSRTSFMETLLVRNITQGHLSYKYSHQFLRTKSLFYMLQKSSELGQSFVWWSTYPLLDRNSNIFIHKTFEWGIYVLAQITPICLRKTNFVQKSTLFVCLLFPSLLQLTVWAVMCNNY